MYGNTTLISDVAVGGATYALFSLRSSPLERVRLLLQLQSSSDQIAPERQYKGIVDAFRRIPSEQGILSLWRGNLFNIVKFIPTQALRFVFGDRFRSLFPTYNPVTDFWKFFGTNMLSGGLAGATSLFFLYPLQLVRTKLALDVSTDDNRMVSGVQCIRSIIKQDGILGLYRGYGMSVLQVLAYRALYFFVYDTIKQVFFKSDKNPNVFASWLFAQGMVIGLGLLAYPLDTVRGHLMMQSGRSEKLCSGAFDCIRKLYAEAGIKAFYRGYCCQLISSFGPLLVELSMIPLNSLRA